jgi:uncharacterized protein Yka (UPF0111/DUF47 family)
MMASLILDAIRDQRSSGGQQNLADQARRLEHKADALTIEARGLAFRLPESAKRAKTVADSAEEANDALEEAAFLLSLMPKEGREGHSLQPLADLGENAVESIAQMIRAVEAAYNLPEGLQADVTDTLRAIDAVLEEETKADAALRKAMAAFIVAGPDARMLVLRIEIGRALETATDHLAHAALALRDHVLGELTA